MAPPNVKAVLLNKDNICSLKRSKGTAKEEVYKVKKNEEIKGSNKSKFHTLGALFIPIPVLRVVI